MKKIVFMSLVVLAGCIGEKESEATMKGSTTCDPVAFEFLIGQSKDMLAGVTVPESVRVMGESDAATMDHRPDRLNVVHDESGMIIGVSCG